MKLILIRHTNRYSSPLFLTSLTEKGKKDATNLKIADF